MDGDGTTGGVGGPTMTAGREPGGLVGKIILLLMTMMNERRLEFFMADFSRGALGGYIIEQFSKFNIFHS